MDADALPECAWDAEHGLVVLYRRIAENRRQEGYSLAVGLEGAQGPSYFAGDFAADRLIWAVRVPREGAFRLYFHPLGPPAVLNGEAPLAIGFDDRLWMDPEMPAGPQHRICGWLFGGSDGRGAEGPVEVEVPHGATVTELLSDPGWDAGLRVGLTLARYAGGAPTATRGPTAVPLRDRWTLIGVYFTQVPDPEPLPKDSVRIPGFTDLVIPAIAVDLSSFGERAEALRDGFCFIHRPHGPEGEFRRHFGSDLPIVQGDDGRRILIWACAEACHLDHLGVFFSGGPRLNLCESSLIRVRGYDGDGPEECLVALYYGYECLMLPTHAQDFAHDGARRCTPLDMTELEIQLCAAWATADERLRGALGATADLRGAERAGVFTLVAYVDVLGQILDAGARGSGREELSGLMDRQGIGFRSFADFARHPDFAFALLADGRLERLLARDRASLSGVLRDDGLLAPAAVLASALEPQSSGVARWVEDEPAAVQRALWHFMCEGGSPSAWRDLGIALSEVENDLPGLVKLTQRARAQVPLFVPATLEDLGQDPHVVKRQPGRLSEARARVAAVELAAGAANRELESVNRDLGLLSNGGRLSARVLADGFAEAIEGGAVPDREEMRRRLLGHLGGQGPRAGDLAVAVTQLRTRLALWGLGERLGVQWSGPRVRPASPGGHGADTLDPGLFEVGKVPEPAAAAPGPPRASEWMPEPEPGAVRREPPSPGFPPGLPADADRPKVLLDWCRAVLIRRAFDFPPADDDGQSADSDLVRKALDDLEGLWGLDGVGDPEPVPAWQGERAREQARLSAALGTACARAEGELALVEPPERREELGALLARLSNAREGIVADSIWMGILGRAEALAEGAREVGLVGLRIRMGHAESALWESLAAELDALEGEIR